MAIRDDARAALDAMGPDRVRHLLKQGMMVTHLMVPAYEWLDELDAAPRGLPDDASHQSNIP